MKFKKQISTFLASVLLLSAVGCSSTTPSTPTNEETPFTAGTYTATGKGNFGDIEVTTVFSEDKIVSVTIGDNIETPDIAKAPFEQIPARVVGGQTLDIDIISGATNTCNGVIEAIENCVEQAGGNVEVLRNREFLSEAKEDIAKTADVIVIGGGGAGLAAAVSAAENGASVILIEKGASLGGNTLRSGGGLNAVDPERQSAVPMTNALLTELKSILEVDENECGTFKDTVATLKGQIQEYLAGDTSYLFDSAELHMYNMYVGGKRTGIDGTEIYSNVELAKVLAENSLSSFEWLSSHGMEISDDISTILGALWPRSHMTNMSVGTAFVTPLANACEKLGVEIMLQTTGKNLIVENNKIVGVNAEMDDGTKVVLNANNGVVIATGGFGANAPMVAEYNNYWADIPLDMKSTNSSNITGDGITMGLEVGANLVGMGFAQLMPSSHPETGALSGGVWTSAESQVFINQEGTRFINEYESRDVLANAALNQTNSIFYIICDQITAGNPQPGSKNGWGDDVDTLVETGSIYKADTLEELAEQIGVPADVLVAEIEKYNQYVENELDTEYGKTSFGPKIENAPFYATPRSPSIHHTMGGIEINTSAQVLNEQGQVIEGLYAAGEVTGGIHAGNRLGGNALADVVVFGKIAGESVANKK